VGAPVSRADDAANEAARELAKKLVVQLGTKQKIQVEFRDLSGLISNSELTEAQLVFNSELIAGGIHLATADEADVIVRVSLSESQEARIWIAQYLKGSGAAPLFLSFAKLPGGTPNEDSAFVRIQSTLILRQIEPILDFAVVKRDGETPTEILILGVETVFLYDRAKGQWNLTKMLQIPHKLPIPRDPRGQIWFRKDNEEFSVGVPGSMCEGKLKPSVSLKCEPNAIRWSFPTGNNNFILEQLEQGRNFFKPHDLLKTTDSTFLGDFSSEDRFFFSATDWQKNGGEPAIHSRPDGRIWLVSPGLRPVELRVNWGSDLVATENGCGNASLVLTTGATDYTSPDYLRAFQIKGESAIAVSSKIEFSGPITALWESFFGDDIRVVVHNLKTGNYEAYEINLACDR
jgi:hypothetical protein